MSQTLRNLSSEAFVNEVKSRIRGTPYRDPSYYGVRFSKVGSHGSGQMIVIMPNGDALAIMSTINKE